MFYIPLVYCILMLCMLCLEMFIVTFSPNSNGSISCTPFSSLLFFFLLSLPIPSLISLPGQKHGRGLYLREPHQLEKPTRFSVYVEPQFHEDTGKPLGTDNHVAFSEKSLHWQVIWRAVIPHAQKHSCNESHITKQCGGSEEESQLCSSSLLLTRTQAGHMGWLV